MGKAIQITLAGKHFPTKTICAQYISALLNETTGDIRGGENFNLLMDLLSRHPRAKEKIGSGISHFSTEYSPVHIGQKYFVVHRTDGSSVDFSFDKCLGWSANKESALDDYQVGKRTTPPLTVVKRKNLGGEGKRAYQIDEWFNWEYCPAVKMKRVNNYTSYLVWCCERCFLVKQDYKIDNSPKGYKTTWIWYELKGGTAKGKGKTKDKCFISIVRIFNPKFNPKIKSCD